MAGPKENVTMTELARDYPEVHLRFTTTVTEALELVTTGEADATITNLVNASFIIKTRGLNTLKI